MIGLDHVIVSMKKTIFLPLVAEKEFGSDLQGVLLFGPSGVGKTHILSCLVGELNYIKEEKCKTFPTISIWKVEPKDILHKWIGMLTVSLIFTVYASLKFILSIFCR